MKHESIIIKGIDLMNRWENDARSAAEVAGLYRIDNEAMYDVSWPDHVTTPRFNGDCEIREIVIPGDDDYGPAADDWHADESNI